MTTTSAVALRSIATHWADLRDALGAPVQHGAFGLGLRGYLAAVELPDLEEAYARRELERDPAQIGERPVPIRLTVYGVMRSVEAALVDLADQTAADVQRPAMAHAPRSWPAADRVRRDKLADADAADLRRWRYTGHRTAVYAALWLLGRVQGSPGPFTPLTAPQTARIGRVSAGAWQRIEHTLDTGARTAELARPCPCGGTITIHGGAGASPLAHCDACGTLWTEAGPRHPQRGPASSLRRSTVNNIKRIPAIQYGGAQ